MKDDNGNYIDMNSTYDNYITWTPSNANKFKKIGIIQGTTDYFNSWKDCTINVDYRIDVPNYKVIEGSFGATQSPYDDAIEHIEILRQLVTLTVTPTQPTDAIVTLAADGYPTVSGTGSRSIVVAKGTEVVWMVAKQGWITQSSNVPVTQTDTITVRLDESNEFRINIDGYDYTNSNGDVVLTNYIGNENEVITPIMERV